MTRIETMAQAIYNAMGDEFHHMGGDNSWLPWSELSFEIKDRYRRIADRTVLRLAETGDVVRRSRGDLQGPGGQTPQFSSAREAAMFEYEYGVEDDE